MLLLLAACTEVDPARQLDPSFGEELREGYHCGLSWVLAHDRHRTLRLQAALLGSGYPPPATWDLDEVTATLGDGTATLQVYVGRCLAAPGCTDDMADPEGCMEPQEIDHAYEAVGGEATLVRDFDGTVSGTVTDLVLEGRKREAPVEVDELVLPPLPEWTE